MLPISIEKMPALNGRIVLLRCDFNVNLTIKKQPLDSTKIIRSYKTINYLLSKGAKVVIIAHLGRPACHAEALRRRAEKDRQLSLRPIYNFLKKDFLALRFVEKPISTINRATFKKGNLFLLENIRFNKGELNNDAKFAKKLALLGDFYVNEAFAASHRKHASLSAITKYLKPFFGFNFIEEISTLKRLKIKKPALLILGGLKVDEKLPMIEKLAPKFSNILLAGGCSFLFYKKQGINVGATKIERSALNSMSLRRLLKNKKILLPQDLIVANAKTLDRVRIVACSRVCNNEAIFDVGPRTILKWSELIKKAKTIIWLGPVGYVDYKQFSHGSAMLAKIIGSRASGRAVGIVGGGETLYSVNKSGMAKYFDYISTGGGATLNAISNNK
ncbi:phosphoglycerate kinase [Candidatus Falkowbacteria bacterium]|nr:phosphoglycerate kinase [Candidatus Falkowbacteria bacterium]